MDNKVVTLSTLSLLQLNNSLRAMYVRLRNKKNELAQLNGETVTVGTIPQPEFDTADAVVDDIKCVAAELDRTQRELDRLHSECVSGELAEEIMAILGKHDIRLDEINGLPTKR